MFSDIRALTFDVFGTVVDWRGSIAAEAAELLGRGQGVEQDWAAFADAWRAQYQPSMEVVRSGQRPFVKLDVLHRENLETVLVDLGISGVPEETLQALTLAWHRLTPWPDVVAGLTAMKKHRIIATLSNGNIALIVNMAKNADLPWDVVLGSEVAGAFKPEPRAYDAAADALSLKPEQCMMVAAHNSDLIAARARGFKAAFVRRPVEYGPEQRIDLEAEDNFEIIAEDFIDLASQLEK